MSATFSELSERIGRVGELYAQAHNIPRDPDWYLLKLTEELGELTAEHLLLNGRSKPNADDQAEPARHWKTKRQTSSASSSSICAPTI